jgi:hypothetical protein
MLSILAKLGIVLLSARAFAPVKAAHKLVDEIDHRRYNFTTPMNL